MSDEKIAKAVAAAADLISETKGGAEQVVTRACQRREIKLSELQQLAKINGRTAKACARRYLASRSVRIAGAHEAWTRLAPKPLKDQPVPFEEIVHAGLRLNMWNASSEPIFYRPSERLNGRMRYFPIRQIVETARDRVAFDVGKVLVELHPNQFLTRGPVHLHDWLQATLPKGAVVITTDIPSCYDTIKRSSVMRDVPLPGHVLKAVLMDTKERAVHLVKEPKGLTTVLVPYSGSSPLPFVDAGPSCRGILIGSALASYASEAVIKNILIAAEKAAPGVYAAAWGDNLIIVLEDASDAARVYAAVEFAVAHNFGMDVLDGLARRKVKTDLPDQFLFCGQWYKIKAGKLQWHTDPSRTEAAMLRLSMKVVEAKTLKDFERIERSMIGYVIANRHMPSVIIEYLKAAMEIGETKITKLAEKLIDEAAPEGELLETI